MYEKHIEALQRADYTADPAFAKAIEAAIALMRAAEPKDEAAEREHCSVACFEADQAGMYWAEHRTVEWFMRERVAARAEVEMKYAALISALDVNYADLPGVVRTELNKVL